MQEDGIDAADLQRRGGGWSLGFVGSLVPYPIAPRPGTTDGVVVGK